MLRIFTCLIVGLSSLFVTACSSVADDDVSPACISNFTDTLIAQLLAQPKQNPVAEITQYTYQGQTVYLVTGGSTAGAAGTTLNYLFDTCGNILCAATGGPNGQGDGRCPGFQTNATNPVLVWRDPR
ncbi:hypothetical protein J0X19_03985 [Hymenobacter sp. BT186]|uniref:DUF6970 domain-containing protein n=1 Tax=Hymenobacter telluris TaxID=2816474 RepID=A0A939EU96_9BACT|nr:hypothetical protein [Hymenobacter telluris]MBO0357096.1 hypothetical protein [Hymenobacter telluris]MBW3373123.1 hypothetical protein [Hymenobacter norwichensis]